MGPALRHVMSLSRAQILVIALAATVTVVWAAALAAHILSILY